MGKKPPTYGRAIFGFGRDRRRPRFYYTYELVNGVIVAKRKYERKGRSGRHGEVIGNLDTALRNFARANKLGRVFATSPFILDDGNYYVPDVAFVAKGRIQEEDFKGSVPVVPDLVAGIHSPSDTLEIISEKI